MIKIAAFAGGVGGAKLVWGLSKIIPQDDLTIIVNTGDDFVHCGLSICPDLDTVMYTLAEMSNEITGWGRKDETWNTFSELSKLNSDNWFRLGDRDLATHLERTRLLNSGLNLTEVTKYFCEKYNASNRIFPMTDDPVSTIINTREYGDLPFQEYFVKYEFKPKFISLSYQGVDKARVNSETKCNLEEAEIVIFCPSNPWLSIMPILAINEIKEIILQKTCIAVSPIIGNAAIKGPAAKIFYEKGIKPSAAEVAELYRGIINGFILDDKNVDEAATILDWDIIPLVTDTIMKDESSKIRLAKEILSFATKINKGK